MNGAPIGALELTSTVVTASPSASAPPPPRTAERPPLHIVETRAAKAICFNGSELDCNAANTTLRRGSAWVDPEPPPGFSQCAGFLNTREDDVAAGFMDGCVGAANLRVRVFTTDGALEEDIIDTRLSQTGAWPNFDYLGGEVVAEKRTSWGDTTFFTTTDGRDACMKPAGRGGITFGSGSANVAIVVGSNTGADEYRISCGGDALPDRRIAIYRDAGHVLQRAR